MTPFNLSPPYLPTSHGLSPSARHKRTRSREARTPAPIVATKGAMLFFIVPEGSYVRHLLVELSHICYLCLMLRFR